MEGLDGIVLAAAGVIRSGYVGLIDCYLPVDVMVPAPAQGALAIEVREGSKELEVMLASIRDDQASLQVAAERGFLEGIGGSCHVPMGAYCNLEGDRMDLVGVYGDGASQKVIRRSVKETLDHKNLFSQLEQARAFGLSLAQDMKREYHNEC